MKVRIGFGVLCLVGLCASSDVSASADSLKFPMWKADRFDLFKPPTRGWMPTIKPDPQIDYKIGMVRPDPMIDYKINHLRTRGWIPPRVNIVPIVERGAIIYPPKPHTQIPKQTADPANKTAQ